MQTWSGRVQAAAGAERWRVTVRLRQADGSETTLGPILESASPPPEWQTPDWAKGCVWYQIMPERFRSGNPANDPRGPDVQPMPWNAPWEVVTPEELDAARARAANQNPPRTLDAHRQGGQLYNVFADRRFGGDLQGVAEKFDELADLGVTAIYLTPVFRARSLHKYDASDYRHIDDTLAHPGPLPEKPNAHDPRETTDPATWRWTTADRFVLDEFLPAARARGLRVIFDGVWNHTGKDHWAFADVFERGQDSPFSRWYDAQFAPPAGTLPGDHPNARFKPGTLLTWRSWNGRNGDLPVFKQTPQRDLVPPVKAHIFDITRRWLAPDGQTARGIDGWRLDVASDIGTAFWRDWRAHVKAIKPDALLIAELWFPGARFFGAEGFDGQMNYPVAQAFTAWLGLRPGMTSAQLHRALEQACDNHPATELVQMNLLCSHDTDRLASMLFNPDRPYDQGRNPKDRPGYRTQRPDEHAYALARLAIAFIATWPGSPMVYYGEEYGLFGADDPDCRKPLPWPDRPLPDNPADRIDPATRSAYRQWLRLRQDPDLGPLLRLGQVRPIDTGLPDVLAFERQLNASRALVVLNRGSTPVDARHWLNPHPASEAASTRIRRFPTPEHSEPPTTTLEPLSAAVWLLAP
jgi:glycosidase